MKLTTLKLKQIIREEASRIEEVCRAPRAKCLAEASHGAKPRINKVVYNLNEAIRGLWEVAELDPNLSELDIERGGEFADIIESVTAAKDELVDRTRDIDAPGTGSSRNYR